jgi:hypothetical protein
MENNSRKMTKYSVYGNSISREVPTKKHLWYWNHNRSFISNIERMLKMKIKFNCTLCGNEMTAPEEMKGQ